LKHINAVIFDMDGLLLDTEKISQTTFVAACREYHFEPDLQVYYQCIGTTMPKTKTILTEGYGQGFPYEAVSSLWRQKFHEETAKPVPLKAGALSLLQYLEQKQIKKAVVTSTKHQRAQDELNNAEILHYFVFILGGDQIGQGKPDPEIYLKACQKLNKDPSCCLALEDSDNGVRSAFSAGLQVIQVPDMLEPSAEVKALGHQIMRSLADVEVLIRKSDLRA
jgi:HAD superfamily hydrolase (TIGR01509 family)